MARQVHRKRGRRPHHFRVFLPQSRTHVRINYTNGGDARDPHGVRTTCSRQRSYGDEIERRLALSDDPARSRRDRDADAGARLLLQHAAPREQSPAHESHARHRPHETDAPDQGKHVLGRARRIHDPRAGEKRQDGRDQGSPDIRAQGQPAEIDHRDRRAHDVPRGRKRPALRARRRGDPRDARSGGHQDVPPDVLQAFHAQHPGYRANAQALRSHAPERPGDDRGDDARKDPRIRGNERFDAGAHESGRARLSSSALSPA